MNLSPQENYFIFHHIIQTNFVLLPYAQSSLRLAARFYQTKYDDELQQYFHVNGIFEPFISMSDEYTGSFGTVFNYFYNFNLNST